MLISFWSGSWQHCYNIECSRRKANGTTGTSPDNWCPGFPKAATSLSNEETQKRTRGIIRVHVAVYMTCKNTGLVVLGCVSISATNQHHHHGPAKSFQATRVENNPCSNMARRLEALGRGDVQDDGVMLIPACGHWLWKNHSSSINGLENPFQVHSSGYFSNQHWGYSFRSQFLMNTKKVDFNHLLHTKKERCWKVEPM